MPKVRVARIDLLARRRNRNPTRLSVGDRILSAPDIPFAPRRYDGEVRGERSVSQLEANLIVALSGAAMRKGVGANLPRNLDLTARNEWTRHRGAKQIFAIVDRAGAKRRIYERLDELFAEIFDIALVGTRSHGLGSHAGQLASALSNVSGDADDARAPVVLFEPRDDDRRVQPAGIGEDDSAGHGRSLFLFEGMQC